VRAKELIHITRDPVRRVPVVVVDARVVGPVVDKFRVVAGCRRDPLTGLVDDHLVLADLGHRVDGYQGFLLVEAEKSTVFDEQEPDLVFSIVDEKIGHLSDTRTVLVLHLAATDIVGRPVHRLTVITQDAQVRGVIACHDESSPR